MQNLRSVKREKKKRGIINIISHATTPTLQYMQWKFHTKCKNHDYEGVPPPIILMFHVFFFNFCLCVFFFFLNCLCKVVEFLFQRCAISPGSELGAISNVGRLGVLGGFVIKFPAQLSVSRATLDALVDFPLKLGIDTSVNRCLLAEDVDGLGSGST